MYCIEAGTCDNVGTFFVPRSHFVRPAVMRRPCSDSAPRELCLPCPPSLRPGIRYIKSDKLRQTNCNEFLYNFVM